MSHFSNLEKGTACREDDLVDIELLPVLTGKAQVGVLLVHTQLPGKLAMKKFFAHVIT